MKKRLGLSPVNADKAIVYLHSIDLVHDTNIAMRARKASLILDYTSHIIKLSIKTPSTEAEVFLMSNPRTKKSIFVPVLNPANRVVLDDLILRWDKHGASPRMGEKRNKVGNKLAQLQLRFEDAKYVALTMMETRKGTSLTNTEFFVPDKE